MSLVSKAIAARMFCCVSARCVTVKVASMPTLNRLVIARITTRPMAEATINSISVNPRSVFAIRILLVLLRLVRLLDPGPLVITRDQSIRRVSARRQSALRITHGDGHGDHVLVDRAAGQQYLA